MYSMLLYSYMKMVSLQFYKQIVYLYQTFLLVKVFLIISKMQRQYPQFLDQQQHSLQSKFKSQHGDLHQEEDIQSISITYTSINIKIVRYIDNHQMYQEWLQSFDLTPMIHKVEFDLPLLLRQLSQLMNIVIDNCEVMLYYEPAKMFIHFGLYPFVQNYPLLAEFVQENTMAVKLKKSGGSLIHLQMGRDMSEYMMNGPPKLLQGEGGEVGLKKKQSSIKNFQRIGYIVKKILSLKSLKRRKRIDFQFKNDRCLTPKSVQDYFNQIKQGYKYNFDFNSNSNQNMKVLREYVKQHDKRSKRSKQNQQKMPLETNQNQMI